MKKVSEQLNIKDNIIVSLNKNYEDNNVGEFKELTSKLNLPKKELIKYTSKIKECANEFKNCKNCENLFQCKNKIEGYKYTPIEENESLKFEYIICPYKEKLNNELEYQKNIYYNSIPDRIINASFDNLYFNQKERQKVIDWCIEFVNNYKKGLKGLFLTGNFGCGKTYILSATLSELAKKSIKSAIIFWPDFINDLKSSFDSDFDKKYNLVKTVDVLLIDDIGAENLTEWGRDEIFCPLIQYRMDNNLTTFFTSNLNMEQLESHFSKSKTKDDPIKARRIIERIKQLTEYVEMVSINLRK